VGEVKDRCVNGTRSCKNKGQIAAAGNYPLFHS